MTRLAYKISRTELALRWERDTHGVSTPIEDNCIIFQCEYVSRTRSPPSFLQLPMKPSPFAGLPGWVIGSPAHTFQMVTSEVNRTVTDTLELDQYLKNVTFVNKLRVNETS